MWRFIVVRRNLGRKFSYIFCSMLRNYRGGGVDFSPAVLWFGRNKQATSVLQLWMMTDGGSWTWVVVGGGVGSACASAGAAIIGYR